jgi:uncharacterized ferritin-like protein (DUF455 family)
LAATLSDLAVGVLTTAEPRAKVRACRAMADAWRTGAASEIGRAAPPARPARPKKPDLLAPRAMPRRRLGGAEGRAAFLHAIAHIELNAVDLACDLIARFTAQAWPRAFFDDWVGVADDEARHFTWLADRLEALGKAYGAYPAHDGLWEAAEKTADDPLARLAAVPMVLEARGLDTTPAAVERLRAAGDADSADLLARIGREEEPHVAAGVRWYEHLCGERGLDPVPTFHRLVRDRLAISLKPPFAVEARDAAGMAEAYYRPAAAGGAPAA